MKYWPALLVLLLVAPAWAQPKPSSIEGPAQIDPYKLVEYNLTRELPPKVYVDGGWEVYQPDGTLLLEGDQLRASVKQLVFVGPPGTYTVVYDGVLLEDIEFVDSAGNKITKPFYCGKVKETRKCVIKGAVNPPVPPPVPGNRWAVIWEDPSARNATLGNLLIRLRLKYPDEQLTLLNATKPSELSARHRALYDAIPSGTTLPALMVLARQPDGSDRLIRVKSVPTSVEAVDKEILQ